MTLDERKRIYLEYLQMKIAEGDYHGVADAAMDLRELEIERRLTAERIGEAPTGD